MSTNMVLLIVVIVIVILVVVWLVRSRGNTVGPHVDTTLTAVGAVTEAVEEVAAAVTHKVEEVLIADANATGLTETLVASLEHETLPAPVTASGVPDDLSQLKGVGPKLVALLAGLGVTRFDQIAAWGPAEIETIDAQLGTFKGRITRDNWIEQASFLAKGDIAGFEARFGKLNG